LKGRAAGSEDIALHSLALHPSHAICFLQLAEIPERSSVAQLSFFTTLARAEAPSSMPLIALSGLNGIPPYWNSYLIFIALQ
jgi:hypothetical protein